MSIKVLVVDNQPVVCEGLEQMLAGTSIKLVGIARDAKQLPELIRKHRPDVVLLEWRLGEIDGLGLMEEIIERDPSAKFVVFSAHDTPTHIARAGALGAQEFLRKSSDKRLIVETIESVHHGRPRETSLIATYQAAIRRRRIDTEDNGPLTNREIQVLRHVAMGLSNREIGKSLDISIETVKEHVQNILRKLDVNDRTQAAVWAVRRELV
jgi:DNA-binding NarL/FixJ family response regulator